jgi:hypothetical protein
MKAKLPISGGFHHIHGKATESKGSVGKKKEVAEKCSDTNQESNTAFKITNMQKSSKVGIFVFITVWLQ